MCFRLQEFRGYQCWNWQFLVLCWFWNKNCKNCKPKNVLSIFYLFSFFSLVAHAVQITSESKLQWNIRRKQQVKMGFIRLRCWLNRRFCLFFNPLTISCHSLISAPLYLLRSVYMTAADIKFISRQTYCPSVDRRVYFSSVLFWLSSPAGLIAPRHSKHHQNTENRVKSQKLKAGSIKQTCGSA